MLEVACDSLVRKQEEEQEFNIMRIFFPRRQLGPCILEDTQEHHVEQRRVRVCGIGFAGDAAESAVGDSW